MSERLPSCYGLMMCRSPYKLAGKQRLPESFSFAGTWLRCVLASQKLTSVRFSFAETHFVRFQVAFIDGMFEWQLVQNEVSAKLKRSVNGVEKQPAHWFVVGGWFGD